MHLRSSLVLLGLLVSSVACGDKGEGDGDDTGGSSSSGGKGSGGTTITAGTKSTAGTDTGGTDSGEAGAPATGQGGSSGAGVTKSYTFDGDVEEFLVSDSSAATMVDPVPKEDVMIGHNAEEGEPEPGSLQMDIPYSAASQYVSTGVDARPADKRAETDPGPDLTGKIITANVMILSGLGDAEDLMTAPANAKIYVKTGAAYFYASAATANITSIGVWNQISFAVDKPGYKAETGTYDPTDVREIGVQIDTNSASTTAAPAVVLIDTISY